MEVLAGAVAVLVPAAYVLRELARHPDDPTLPTTAPVGRPTPRELAMAVTPADRLDERAVAPPEEPDAAGGAPAAARARVEAEPKAAPPGFAPAPVLAPATAPETVAVRVPARARPVAPRPEQDPATVLGVFGDTEPDRRTEGARRAASALALAAVTAAVAAGVGGVIYLGLSRLG